MRCYLPPACWNRDPLVLDQAESHYLRRVLRLGAGDTIEVFDGAGRVAPGVLAGETAGGMEIRLGPVVDVPSPSPALVLVQALPKGPKMDWILEKGTELGVQRFQPVETRHAVVRLPGAKATAKRERWQGVVLAAARQCGTAWVPAVQPVRGLVDWLKGPTGVDWLLWGDLRPDAVPLREVLAARLDDPPASIGFLVGPEGDFSDPERAALDAAGAVPVCLGPSTLRTETAAVYAMGALRYTYR